MTVVTSVFSAQFWGRFIWLDLCPLEPNSVELKKRYEAAGKGDLVTLIVAPDEGHSFWEGFFHCQPLVDFLIARAKAEPLDGE